MARETLLTRKQTAIIAIIRILAFYGAIICAHFWYDWKMGVIVTLAMLYAGAQVYHSINEISRGVYRALTR
jgi:hypothetical protein